MSTETLSTVASFRSSAAVSRPRTYSIAPVLETVVPEKVAAPPANVGVFLEGENPLGCIRGVMWMMAFNVGAFALGFLIWRSCKLLF